jgi:large subunit ribosomal protein L35Ae
MHMKGVIVNYRRGKRTLHPKQAVLLFPQEKNPASLIGRTVAWKSEAGKEIRGKITALHGRKGAVRARFSRGLPGQALGSKISVLEKGGVKPTAKKKAVKTVKKTSKPKKKTSKPKKKPKAKKKTKSSKPKKPRKKAKKKSK